MKMAVTRAFYLRIHLVSHICSVMLPLSSAQQDLHHGGLSFHRFKKKIPTVVMMDAYANKMQSSESGMPLRSMIKISRSLRAQVNGVTRIRLMSRMLKSM